MNLSKARTDRGGGAIIKGAASNSKVNTNAHLGKYSRQSLLHVITSAPVIQPYFAEGGSGGGGLTDPWLQGRRTPVEASK